MFPIKDTIRSRTFPIVNWMLILANVLIFLYENSLSPQQLDPFILRFALIPARIDLFQPLTWYPLITHMFLHGGWFHLLSNMWFLMIFGDNVEDRLGSSRYLLFYLLGGIFGGLLQSYLSLDSTVPALGASGAIAAVLGAYILFYPRARVITLILLVIIPIFVEIPAVIYLGIWFVAQLFSGLASLSAQSVQMGGVAWFAHIGGFVFGLVMAKAFTIGRAPHRWYPDEYYPY